MTFRLLFAALPIAMIPAGAARAQLNAPAPLPNPPITGPLQPGTPIVLHASPLGQLDLDGVLTGMGLAQNHPQTGAGAGHAALSNGQIFLQKPSGWWQFYVQAGAYNLPTLGAPYASTASTVNDFFGPVPVAYLKLAARNTSLQIGALPTLMGAEWTFDFQNMNIERGLLWAQENAINRGVQFNQSWKKLSASLSWTDGYYSNRYSWLSGALNFVSGAHVLSFQGMGNLSQTAFRTAATPVQNNSTMYAGIYTFTKGGWIVQPYAQFSHVPASRRAGIARGAGTQSGALLMSYGFKHGFSLAGRGEFMAASGSADSPNLLYGPGSAAWSLTATPTWQRQRFFVRGDVSLVHALSFTSGDAFGAAGEDASQARGVLEMGFLF